MINRKKNAKKILVFFLIFGLIGGTMDHLRVTAAAGTEEEGSSGTEAGTEEDISAQTDCICTDLCTAETKEPDCAACREDLSACKGQASEVQPGNNPDESGNTDAENPAKLPADPEAAAVKELLNGLPSLEELKALEKKELDEAYEQIQKAFDAYENLEAEQKAMLPGAEEELKELLEYFTTLIMPLATDQQIEAAWNAMTTAMVNWDQEVDLSAYNLNSNDWGKIWPDVAQDNPDLFYVLDGTYYTSPDGIVQKCTFTYNSQYNQNSVAEYRAAINNVFSEVIGNNMTDEQKATALHDYLVQHMVYDQNANNNLGIEKRNAYEALVNGIGVCQGYTLAYAALLKEAGIEVDYCKSQSMNHIWNYVKLNGSWYHADLTYDDATAASQTGETGYVKHEYFLLSDSAMRSKAHNWDSNSITCADTSYDNSWHKTAPITESAIYAVNGNSYYLKGEIVAGAPNTIYSGASLMKRDANGNETQVAKLDIENVGNGWPMYSMSFSRLSCSKGVLYFNVGNSVYSFNPAADTVPVKIYQYEDQSNRIVTGLLANSERMTLEIYNPNTGKIEDKIVVSMTGMEEQKDFAFPVKTKTVTYGDADFTMTAKGAAEGSSVSYSSSDPSVASVDTRTGLVQIQKAGSAVITATASAVGNYEEVSSSYQLTVSPKALAWDVSALEAADRLDQIKDREATLFGELKLEGILEKDAKLVLFDCPAEKLSGVYETAAEGSQKVALSWKNAQDEAILEGNGKENYTMHGAVPEIILHLNQAETVTGLVYKATEGTPIGSFKIYVSEDGGTWKQAEVRESQFALDANGQQTIHFTDGKNLYTYDASYVKIVAEGQGGKRLTISEISLLGQTGDDVVLTAEGGIGILKNAYIDNGQTLIPAGSLVFTGTYKGNPAYNTVLLWDENGTIVGGLDAEDNLNAGQYIFAPDPQDGMLGEVSDGIWVYYIEPEYVSSMNLKKVRAELYRVDNAETQEGERMVSSTMFVDVPSALPDIELNAGTAAAVDRSSALKTTIQNREAGEND